VGAGLQRRERQAAWLVQRNLSLWIENDEGLKIELYAKNILDKTPITDAFINSDDTALTTNVFVLDPRLIGLSIRKEF
jgi:outer membrane receptor protein involved in Fe transport